MASAFPPLASNSDRDVALHPRQSRDLQESSTFRLFSQGTDLNSPSRNPLFPETRMPHLFETRKENAKKAEDQKREIIFRDRVVLVFPAPEYSGNLIFVDQIKLVGWSVGWLLVWLGRVSKMSAIP